MTFNAFVNRAVGGPPPSGEELGLEYLAVTQAIGGVAVDVRASNSDWSDGIYEISRQAAPLAWEFPLTETPVVDTLVVRVELPDGAVHEPEDDAWTYLPDANSIAFVNEIVPPMAELVVQYEIAP